MKIVALLAATIGLSISVNAVIPEVDLDGQWDFRVDPADVGEKERWFDASATPSLGGTITSPGVWVAQGVGNATDLMTHQYNGVSWYRKSVHINSSFLDGGNRIYLWIGGAPGGVMRSATVYANGLKIGRHVGYWAPLEMELTDVLKARGGPLTLAVAVDSRWNTSEDALFGSGCGYEASWDGYSIGGYGGIVGHSKLLVRKPMWIDDSVHVATVPLSSPSGGDWQCRFRLQLAGKMAPGTSVSIEIAEWSPSGSLTPVASTGPMAVVGVDQKHFINATVRNAKLWYPGGPTPLYSAIVKLNHSSTGILDEKRIRFGIRSLELKGSRIIWNGERLYLRGYGDDAAYGHSVAPPVDKSYYVSQLRAMQPFGFNFVRLHSHALPTEFFEAADELGFLVDAEFPMTYDYGCTGSCPGRPLVEVTSAVKLVYNESFASFVKRYSHHPSVFAYVLSNEVIWDATNQVQFAELYRFAKDFDPDRPCWWSDGAVATETITPDDIAHVGCKGGKNISNEFCFADILVTQSAWAHTPSSSDAGSGLPGNLSKPSLIHEGADQRAFPRLQEQTDALSDGPMRPMVMALFDEPIKDMARLGLLAENEMWAIASEKLYTLTMKTYLENWLLDAATSGFEWWTGFDWFATANGLYAGDQNNVLPKPGIDNLTIAAVQSEVAILVQKPAAFQNKGYEAGQLVSFDLLLSNLTFAGHPHWGVSSPWFIWEAAIGESVFARAAVELPVGCVPQGELMPVVKASFMMPNVAGPETVNVKARVSVGGALVANNQWQLGVFPRSSPAGSACGLPVYVSSAQMLPEVKEICSEAQMLPTSGVPTGDSAFVVLVDSSFAIKKELIEASNKVGGVLIFLSPAKDGHFPVCEDPAQGTPRPVPTQFRQAWWMGTGTVGTLVYNNSELTEGIGEFLDFRWQELVDGSLAYNLDNSSYVKVHIRSLPVFQAFSVKSFSQIHNLALLWEARLPNIQRGFGEGAGRYIVSGLALQDSPGHIRQTPQAKFMLQRLVKYAAKLAAQGLESVGQLPSFCTAGAEAACQGVFNQSAPLGSQANFKVVQPVVFGNNSGSNEWLDAVHIHVVSTDPNAKLRAVIYSHAPSPDGWSGCMPRGDPDTLLAVGKEVTSLPGASGGWVRLPVDLPQPLQPGTYWIGALFSSAMQVFGVMGGGRAGLDAYGWNTYISGPTKKFGPSITGSASMDVYATVTQKPSMEVVV
mmetsp:Transcript_104058/g.190592  ORF Transcript_104058/g.190592 Transcript_104058/m.190592 type:complete len:1211 (-) Transcript_104058:50-3682(-)